MPRFRHLTVSIVIVALTSSLPATTPAAQGQHRVGRGSVFSRLLESMAEVFAKIGLEIHPGGDAFPYDDCDDQAHDELDGGVPP